MYLLVTFVRRANSIRYKYIDSLVYIRSGGDSYQLRKYL